MRIAGAGVNDFGEHIEVLTDYPQWAMLIQDNVARYYGEGGSYGLAGRTWRVRFDQRFIDAQEAGQTIAVLYADEQPDIVTGTGEPTTAGPLRRRRFLDLTTDPLRRTED